MHNAFEYLEKVDRVYEHESPTHFIVSKDLLVHMRDLIHDCVAIIDEKELTRPKTLGKLDQFEARTPTTSRVAHSEGKTLFLNEEDELYQTPFKGISETNDKLKNWPNHETRKKNLFTPGLTPSFEETDEPLKNITFTPKTIQKVTKNILKENEVEIKSLTNDEILQMYKSIVQNVYNAFGENYEELDDKIKEYLTLRKIQITFSDEDELSNMFEQIPKHEWYRFTYYVQQIYRKLLRQIMKTMENGMKPGEETEKFKKKIENELLEAIHTEIPKYHIDLMYLKD